MSKRFLAHAFTACIGICPHLSAHKLKKESLDISYIMSLIRSQNNLYSSSIFFQDSKIATGNPHGVFLLFLSFFLHYISSKLDFPAFLLPHIGIISVNAHNKTSDIFIEVLTLFAIMQQILSLHLIQRSLKTIQTANFCRRTVSIYFCLCTL